MSDAYQIQHRPTDPYSTWVHVTVEGLSRDILAAAQATMAELRLGHKLWSHSME